MMEDLRDPANFGAWSAFDARYRPVLIAFARKLGFGHEDATELAQQSLAEFARCYHDGRYQRSEGRLSSWLIGIARNVGSGMRRKEGRGGARAGGDTMLGQMPGELPDAQQLTIVWRREREHAILNEAMSLLRSSARMEEHTFRAFELFALRGVPAEEVASQCGIEVDSVYVIKNRLTKRLREIVADITAAYDEGE